MQLLLAIIAALLVNHVNATFRVIYPAPWTPLLTNSVTYRAEDPSLENLHIAQFHSQDAAGRYVFGFNTPDQARVEARSHDGKVRGSYSYLDPFGRTVKVNAGAVPFVGCGLSYHPIPEVICLLNNYDWSNEMEYWDNGHGFHLAEPKDGFHHIYTPEVQAARDLHFYLYNQALHAALAGSALPVGGIPFRPDQGMNDYDDEDDDGNYNRPGSQSQDKNENESSNVNNDKNPSSSTSSSTTVSPASEFPENPDADPFGQTDFNTNPDFPFDPSQDYYKQLEQLDDQFDFISKPNKEIFDAEKESIIVDSAATTYNNNRGFKDRSGKSVDLSDEKLHSTITDSSSNPSDKNIKVHVVPDISNSDTVVESSVNNNGFFYQFQHPIYSSDPQLNAPLQSGLVKSQPLMQVYTQLKPSGPPESLHATLYGAIPVDAVHDSQVSPKQEDSIRNHQVLPLFINVPNL